jgi:hypothetical protein
MMRRNRAELAVRDRLGEDPGIYIHRSRLSEPADGAGPEVIVSVIARDELARKRAEQLLADVAGFPAQEWAERWRPLDLGDSLVRLYPESVAPSRA